MIGCWHIIKIDKNGKVVSDLKINCDNLPKKNLVYHKYAHFPWFKLMWEPNIFID